MTRRTKTPDDQLAALHEKRVGLATKRHEVDAAMAASQRVVDAAPERRRAVLVAETRGETPPETVEQVDRERHAAEVALADGRDRAAALQTVEQEVGQEVDAVIDANPDHYIAAAEAASETAAEAIISAKTAAQGAAMAWREAAGAWGVVWQSHRRRRLDTPPNVPISDFGNAVSELEKSQSRPFPGGSRAAWQRFCEHESQRVIHTASAPTERDPLMERIG
jgi:hypothetical protein